MKIADFDTIETKRAPCLGVASSVWHASTSWRSKRYGENLLVHIVDREARRGPWDRIWSITKCNRVLDGIENFYGRDLGNHRLCSRCGTDEEFLAIQEEYKRAQVEWRARHEREQERKKRDAKERRERENVMLQGLFEKLIEAGFDATVTSGHDYVRLFVEYEGGMFYVRRAKE